MMTRAEYVALLTRIGVPATPSNRTAQAVAPMVRLSAAPRYHSTAHTEVDLGSWDFLNSLDDGGYYD